MRQYKRRFRVRHYEHDEIEIVSWICEMGRVRGAWTHEIYSPHRAGLLARGYSVGIFVSSEGKPVSAPDHIVRDVLRGHSGEAP